MGFIRETHVTNSLHFEFTLAFLQLESFRVLTSSVQYKYSSVCQSCPTLCNPMVCSTPDFPVNYHLRELAQTQVHRVSDAIQPSILCHSLLLLPSIFPSIRVFSNKLALYIRWPKYWSFSFSISPSNEYSGLVLNIEYSGWPLSMGLFKDVIFKKQLGINFEPLKSFVKNKNCVQNSLEMHSWHKGRIWTESLHAGDRYPNYRRTIYLQAWIFRKQTESDMTRFGFVGTL